MRGSNPLHTFELPLASVRNIVLLSISRVREPRAWARRERSPDVAGALVKASLPGSVAHQLARTGRSAADMARLLKRLSMREEPATEADVLEMLADQCATDLRHASSHRDVRSDRDQSLDRYLAAMLIETMRRGRMEFIRVLRPSTSIPFEDLAIMNDLDWESNALLLLSSADTIRIVRDVPRGTYGPVYVTRHVQLGPYTFIMIAALQGQLQNALAELDKSATQHRLENPSYPPAVMIFNIIRDATGGTIVPEYLLSQQTGRTRTARTLQRLTTNPDRS